MDYTEPEHKPAQVDDSGYRLIEFNYPLIADFATSDDWLTAYSAKMFEYDEILAVVNNWRSFA